MATLSAEGVGASREKGRTTCEVFEHLKSLTTDPAMQAYLQAKIDGLKARDIALGPVPPHGSN
jgi:hypothetical protein